MTSSACYGDGTAAEWQGRCSRPGTLLMLPSQVNHKREKGQPRSPGDKRPKLSLSERIRDWEPLPKFIWGTYVKTLACIQSLTPVSYRPSLRIWDQASLPHIPKHAGCGSPGQRKGGCLYQSFFHGGKKRAGHPWACTFHTSPLVPQHLPHLLYQQTEVHCRKLATTASKLSSSDSSEPSPLLQPNQHLLSLRAADKRRKLTVTRT